MVLVMELTVPSAFVPVALGFAVLLILLLSSLFLFLFQFPPFFSLSRPAPTKNPSASHLDADEPVMDPTVIDINFLKGQSLLDLPFADQLQFPALQPQSASAPGLARSTVASRAPVIRQVHDRTRFPRRPGCAPKRHRGRSKKFAEELTASQGSSTDATFQSSKQPGPTENLICIDYTKKPVAIRWALDHASVFESHAEELQAARNPGNPIERGLKDSLFFQWGLRYIPPFNNQNAYRAILIEMLPSGVSLDQILPRMSGGKIYSATLCDTSAITNAWTAKIVFVHGEGAKAFLHRVAMEGFYVNFKPVLVRQVSTPTYLLNSQMVQEIQKNGATRCLAVLSTQKTLKATLHRLLTWTSLHKQVECFGERDAHGVTSIRFHSIRAAIQAHAFLSNSKDLNASIRYDADPCSA